MSDASCSIRVSRADLTRRDFTFALHSSVIPVPLWLLVCGTNDELCNLPCADLRLARVTRRIFPSLPKPAN